MTTHYELVTYYKDTELSRAALGTSTTQAYALANHERDALEAEGTPEVSLVLLRNGRPC